MDNNLVVDSDFLYSLFIQEDPHYTKVQKLIPKIDGYNIIICNLVIYEVATLLSRRISQVVAKNVLSQLLSMQLQVIYIDKQLEREIIAEFTSHSKKNISFVDCANLVLAKKYKAKIVSFDQFYSNNLLI